MAKLLKGAPVAAAITESLKIEVQKLHEKGIIPKLVILRVGEQESDISYERGSVKRCDAVGISSECIFFPESVPQPEILECIEKLNGDERVHGILLLRPLPNTLNEEKICAAIKPEKDVDGSTAGWLAKIFSGWGVGYPPCTAQSVMELINFYGIEVAGKKAVVIGRSPVIGRPVALLLTDADATVTVCHSKTVNMPEITRAADIVVVAVGRAEAVTAEYLAPGQVVIDVGINYSEGKPGLVGDVAFKKAEALVAAISPVPGGVGSVTTAVLCSHVLEAAKRNSLV